MKDRMNNIKNICENLLNEIAEYNESKKFSSNSTFEILR